MFEYLHTDGFDLAGLFRQQQNPRCAVIRITI